MVEISFLWKVISCFSIISRLQIYWINYFTILNMNSITANDFRSISTGKEFMSWRCVSTKWVFNVISSSLNDLFLLMSLIYIWIGFISPIDHKYMIIFMNRIEFNLLEGNLLFCQFSLVSTAYLDWYDYFTIYNSEDVIIHHFECRSTGKGFMIRVLVLGIYHFVLNWISKGRISNILSSHFIIYWYAPYHLYIIRIYFFSWIVLNSSFWNVISSFFFFSLIYYFWNYYFTISM